MTKTEFVAKYAETKGIAKTQAAEDVNTFLNIITDTVASGDAIVIPGVFSIKRTFKEAHEANNPRKPGEKMTVPARYGVKLKAGTAFLEKLNAK